MIYKWKRLGENSLFLAPSIILTLTLGIYPLIWMLRYMFYDYAGYGEALFTGLDNFSRSCCGIPCSGNRSAIPSFLPEGSCC